MGLEDIDLVNFPTTKGCFKVVQMKIRGRVVVIFASYQELHAKILESYLTQLGLKFSRIPIPKFPRLTMPALTGPDYTVSGMGQIDVDPGIKFFQLPYGRSVDYNIGVDKGLNQKLKTQLTGWNF